MSAHIGADMCNSGCYGTRWCGMRGLERSLDTRLPACASITHLCSTLTSRRGNHFDCISPSLDSMLISCRQRHRRECRQSRRQSCRHIIGPETVSAGATYVAGCRGRHWCGMRGVDEGSRRAGLGRAVPSICRMNDRGHAESRARRERVMHLLRLYLDLSCSDGRQTRN
jgi:hypothetical protein